MFLITRPEDKALRSAELFSQAGLTFALCPVQKIERVQDAISSNFQPQIVIVTSTYAVPSVSPALLSQCVFLIGIGDATADLLRQKFPGYNVLTPAAHSSEGLLAMPELCDLAAYSVAIIKGEGGRTVLEETLKSRAVTLQVFEVYRRLPNLSAKLIRQVEELPVTCIIVSSTEIAQLIIAHFSPTWLENKQWIVASERISNYLQLHKYTDIHTSSSANDKDIIKLAKQLSPA